MVVFILDMDPKMATLQSSRVVFNRNKAGLFEGSLSLGGRGGGAIYLKYVESEKNVDIICYKLTSLV